MLRNKEGDADYVSSVAIHRLNAIEPQCCAERELRADPSNQCFKDGPCVFDAKCGQVTPG